MFLKQFAEIYLCYILQLLHRDRIKSIITKSCYLRQEQLDNDFQPIGESDFCNLGLTPTVQVRQIPPTRDSPSSWSHPPDTFGRNLYSCFLFVPLFLRSACALGRKGPSSSFPQLGRILGRGGFVAMIGKGNIWGQEISGYTNKDLVARVKLYLKQTF